MAVTPPKEPAKGDPPPPDLDPPPDATGEPNETDDKPDDAELGDAGKRALQRERSARRAAEAKLKELEPLAKEAAERAEAEKSELTKTNEALAAERDARVKAETALLRHEVAASKGVPANLARFLTGADKEEIEAAADVLLAEVGTKPAPSVPGRPNATTAVSNGRPSTSNEDLDPLALITKARSGHLPPI
jgi:hypothetical protein